MKFKHLPILLLAMLTSWVANANPVDLETAREVGMKFVNANAKVSLRGAQDLQLVTTYHIERGDAAFHIFNTPNGFVIVAADDCATPILGYSDEGRPFDPDNVPIQLQEYLQGFVKQIQYGIENVLQPDEATARQWELVRTIGRLNNNRDGEAVEPLLTTQWNQDWPFNDKCPVDIDGDRCLVGCVAVALGQIMKYHNWPYKGNGYVHYTLQNIPDTISAVFDTTYYDWEGMPDGWTTSGYESMAQLLADVGKSLFMEYSASSSGAFEDIQTLADVFNYDYFSMQEIKRDHMDDSTWTALIKNEMDNNRPVYYSGYSDPDPTVATGHGFVCDGYDENGMYHFNFGWGGNCDGYFMLSHIYSPFFVNFNYYQSALIGIQPATGNTLSGIETLSGSLAFDESLYCGAFSNITIQPGSELRFAPGKGMCVAGSILANGTEEDPILFTASDTTLGWGGLQIHPSMICYKMLEEPDTLSINHATISFSDNDGIILGWPNSFCYPVTPDNIIHKGMALNHVIITHNDGKGVRGEITLLKMDSCEIYQNKDWGVYFDLGALELTNSILGNNNGCILLHTQSELYNKSSIINNNKIFNHYTDHTNYFNVLDLEFSVDGSLFSNNEIFDNVASQQIIWCYGAPILHNSFHDNVSYGDCIISGEEMYGNEIYNNQGWAIQLTGGDVVNNLIYNNSGGIYTPSGFGGDPTARVYNNTIVNNNSGISYGEYYYSGTFDIRNNILWNGYGNEIVAHNDSKILAYNNIIKGGNSNVVGENPNDNIDHTCDKPPRFINPTTFIGTGDIPDNVSFELALSSPAIDNGYTDTTMTIAASDLNGNPRINRTLDIGAYENQSDTIHPCFFSDESLIKSCVGLPLDLYYPYRGENCSFAWYHNDNMIPDTNSDTLHIGTITENDEGDFYCVISNTIGIDTSSVIHLSLSPQLPGCIETIYGSDTIYHFQRNVPFSINNVQDAELIEWVVSEGLSYTKTSDTTILVSVDQAVDSAYLYVVASNGCGACADTAMIHFTVLPLPRQIGLGGDDLLITNCDFSWPNPTILADDSFYYDDVEWQTPSWLDIWSWEKGILHILSSTNYFEDTDTIYARWVVNGYGTGDWTPFPMRVFHSENYADIVYVTEQGGGREDGSTWTNATSDLSEGIMVASYLGKTLWVAKGTYYGETAFVLTRSIEMYGGFWGNEDSSFDISSRSLFDNASVIDGQDKQSLINESYYFGSQSSIIDGFFIQHAKGCGANFYSSDNNDTIRNCVFRYNNMDNGMASAVNGGVVQNCLFYENTGRPIYGSYVSNATIVNNSGDVDVLSMTNSIVQGSYVWGEVSYSAMDAWDGGGEGNILLAHNNNGNSPDSLYVRFVDPENGDFRLRYGSACINAGTPDISGLGLPSVDLQGNPRVMDGRIDMGAYEFDPQTVSAQTIALVLGYNPVSTYLDVTLDEIKASLVSAFGETTTGIKVIAPDGSSSTYSYRSSTGYYWRGNVNNWDVTQSLTVYAPVVPTGSFVLEGERLGSVGISIVEDYNCITYPCDTEMPFATAFAGFAAVNGDKVIAPDGSSATYNGTTWRGQLSLQSLVPGAGYTYFSASATSRTLTFPSGGGGK